MQIKTITAASFTGLVSLTMATPIPQDPPAGTWSVYIYDDINFRGNGTGVTARLGHCENTPFSNVLSVHPVHSSECYLFDVVDCPTGTENRDHRVQIDQDTQNLNSEPLKHWANNVFSIRCDFHS